MKQYLELLEYILENGESRDDRTGTGVLSSFGHQLRFNLQDGFPAVTTKSLAWKGVVSELLWFIEGSYVVFMNIHYRTRGDNEFYVQLHAQENNTAHRGETPSLLINIAQEAR